MTAHRVLITQERIVQVDDADPSKCGARCQFLSDGVMPRGCQYCRLEGVAVRLVDRNRTDACVGWDVTVSKPGRAAEVF